MIQMTEVKSAAMKAWGYDPVSCTLAIRFKSDRMHHYFDVPQEAATAFADHPSKGRAIGEVLGAGGFRSEAALDAETATTETAAAPV